MIEVWELKPLGQIVALQRGFDLPTQHRAAGTVAVIGSNGIVGMHDAAPSGIPVPGLMVGRSGSVGKLTYCHREYWPLNTSLYVKDFHGNDPKFLSYWLQLFPFKQYAEGVSVPTLNRNSINDILFPLPEKDDQRAISGALDVVARSIDLQTDLVTRSLELKRATMRDLFTRGLRGEAQKDSEIGPVPESWEIKTLLELCTISSGGTPRKSVAEYWNGELPWVSGKDLKKPTLDDAIDHISDEGAAAGSKIALADAVLILVRGMGLAKDLPVARISRPMAFNQDLKALISKGEVTGAFLRSAIYNRKDALLSRIVPSAHGTMTLNLDDLESFKIAYPTDLDEVAEITATLDAIDAKIDLHKRKKAVLEELFRALLHKLMTGEIRVGDLDLSALDADQEVAA